MPRFNTLGFRLTIYTVATFTALLLVCFTLLYWSVNSLLEQRMDDDLLEDISEFSLTLDDGGITQVIREVKKETANGEHDSVFLVLLDADLKAVFQSDMSFWKSFTPDLTLAQNLLYTEAEPELLTLDIDTQDSPTRVVYGRLSPNYLLVLGESTEDKDDITDLLVIAFSIVFLLAVPVAALLVWFVTRRTVSGIKRVSEAAQAIHAGNLDMRVDTSGQLEEVQTLADTFDAMTARIQTLIHHMREMTDNIAHDLRSPLGRIRLIAESSLKDSDDVEVRENVERTVTECDRLIKMIDLSLDVAEAEAGVLTLKTQSVNVSALVQDTCDFFEPAITLQKIDFRRAIATGCRVMGDDSSLQRLISNLLDNALKYTPKGGEIVVCVKAVAYTVQVEVADSGVGIPADSLNQVFDRFYRVDTSRGGHGSGLGLSYAYAVAKAHNGELSVSSTLGSGTKFTLQLPCLEPPRSAESLAANAGKARETITQAGVSQ